MRRATLAAAVALALPALAGAQQGAPPSWGWDAPQDEPQVDVNVGLAAGGAPADLSTFQEPLAAQGQWLTVPSYGQVWRPAGVAQGWRPYYYGRWEWTDEGWLWVSDEPWGWATYHYGRWAWDPGYGWIWVPGYQWAPAWVTWRYGPDEVGWAPLAPGFSVYVSTYPVALTWWTFMPCGSFVGVPVWRHAYPPREAHRFWGQTRPAPPRVPVYGHAGPSWGGPARRYLEERTGRAVTPVRVQMVGSPQAASAPGRGASVPVYRPEPRQPRPAGQAPDRRGWTGPAPGGGAMPPGRQPQRAPAPQQTSQPRPAPLPQAPRPGPAGPGWRPPEGAPGPQPGRGWQPAQSPGQAVPHAPAPQHAPAHVPAPQPQPQPQHGQGNQGPQGGHGREGR